MPANAQAPSDCSQYPHRDPAASATSRESDRTSTLGLTQVELLWDEGRLERWIRFGRPVDDHIIDRQRRVLSFATGSIFAFVRWRSNNFGTTLSRIDILRTVQHHEAMTSISFVHPGGELLLRASGWPKVQRVLQLIDAIEQDGFDPVEVCPDHWRHIHNRLSAGQEPRDYTRQRHVVWLARKAISP